jgi:transcriptional regulator with XRE-family HTH domain
MRRDPSLSALGRNLRNRREKRGLTQEKLGELAELDPTYISGIERGIRNLLGRTVGQLRIATRLRAAG